MGFFSNRRNRIIIEKIKEANMSSDYVETNVHWEAFEKFAKEHGGKTDRYSDGGQDTAFNINTNEIYPPMGGINDDFLRLLYKSEKEMLEAKSQDRPETFFKVFGVRNRMDGATLIKVQHLDDFKKESAEFSKKIGVKSSISTTEEEDAEAISSTEEEDAETIRLAEENLAAFKKEFGQECPMCSKSMSITYKTCVHCNYEFE